MKYFLTLLIFSSVQSFAQHSARLMEGWQFLRGDAGGIWEVVRPAAKGSPESVPLWENISLPHCYNAEDAVDPDVNYYQGPAWYRTQIVAENPYSNGRIFLHFEGAGQKSEVYVYTTKVGSHVGGYDEWRVDITDAVEEFRKNPALVKRFKGKIPVAVRTDNSRDVQMIPSDMADFNLYGGLYRYVNLIYMPPVSFEKVFVDARVGVNGKSGRVHVIGRFDKTASGQQSIWVRLMDPQGKEIQKVKSTVKPGGGDVVLAEFEVANPRLWSPDSPRLYTLEAGIENGENSFVKRVKTGFRHFEFVEKGPFRLNGERLLLKGTHRHEDHAGVGAAMTEDMIRREFALMKEMGANFIRLGHYQNSRIALELCDSLGFLAWEEIPWNRGGLGGHQYKEQARRMLTNMIEQHYNHPSVILWGLGNENDWPGDFEAFDTVAIQEFMRELHNLSHKLDPSRLTAIRRCDFCKDIVDVYSPSIWAGWYRGVYTEYHGIAQREFGRVKRFFHAEWGGDSHAGRHSENSDKVLLEVGKAGAADERTGDASLYGGAARVSKDGDWSESYICNLFDWHLKEQENMPWLTGSAQWIFKDFSTPLRPENPVPYVNQKGVVERDFTKKEAFYVFQSYWSNKPMAHIYGHSMPVRWGEEGELKMIKVYSNCNNAELFVNGKSLGVKNRNTEDFPAAGLRWELPLFAGEYIVKVKGMSGSSIVWDSISFTYQSEKWGRADKLVLEKVAEENGMITIEAKLLDEKGMQCLDARNWLRFGLTGEGELTDNQGTSSGSRLVQLYNGRAVIRVDARQGRSVVSAKIEGLPVTFIEL